AAAAGAIAVIIGNNRPQISPGDGWFPTEMTGGPSNTIPAVMIDITNYYALTNAMAAGTVNVTLNPIDDSMSIGEADVGRGASDTLYKVYVPSAGAYPLRTVYWQGGGGGNCEWFSVASDGSFVLLNDTNSLALKTFRAATFVAKPQVSVSRSGSTVTITFTGTLQSSATVNGTYADVPSATSPYIVPTGAAPAQFYRSR
ncbi:MAG TPA: hypothetical protein VL793_14180, partial [Patescibacteria group bacterium]|nr:hypothetical protein [Patescibacteria group bacterium]